MFCDFCGFANISIRRIQSEKVQKGYILSCKNCEIEKGLEGISTYSSNGLLDFYDQRRRDPISPTLIETDDGSKYIQFNNGRLQLLEREELKLIADEIYKTLALDHSLDDFIEENNNIKKLEDFYTYSKTNKDKFQIPYDRLRLSKKHFNPIKNKWSFKCGNCSNLINIDVQNHYYTIVPETMFNANSERGCSKGCTKIILKDIIKNWLHYTDTGNYFYKDDLEDEVTYFINNI